MIKCVCINDKNKPENIPDTHWVKFGQEYTVETVYDLMQPGAIMGISLQEIDLSELDTDYRYFPINRFGFKKEDLVALEQLIGRNKGLQNFDLYELIEEEVLVGKTLDDFDDYLEYSEEDKDLGDL